MESPGWGRTADGLAQASELNLVLSQAMHSHTQADFLEFGRGLRRALDLALELYTMPPGTRSKSASVQVRATRDQFVRWLEFGATARLLLNGTRLLSSVNRRWRDAQDVLPVVGGCAGGLVEVGASLAPELLDDEGAEDWMFTAALLTAWSAVPTPSFELPQRSRVVLISLLTSSHSRLDLDARRHIAVLATRFGWADVRSRLLDAPSSHAPSQAAGWGTGQPPASPTAAWPSPTATPRSAVTQPPPPATPRPAVIQPPAPERVDSVRAQPSEHAVAGWFEDPTGRYPKRFWDGRSWTDDVLSAWGSQLVDQYKEPGQW